MTKLTETRDACDQRVSIGDLIAFVQPRHRYLCEGVVSKINPSGGVSISDDQGRFICSRSPQLFVKLPSELRLERLVGI